MDEGVAVRREPRSDRAGVEHIQSARHTDRRDLAGECGECLSTSALNEPDADVVAQAFKELPDAQKVTFVQVPPVDLLTLLPNLPPADTQPEHAQCLDLVSKLLVYPPERRLRPAFALKHGLFVTGMPLLLPVGYPADDGPGKHLWGSRRLADVLSPYLSSPG